MANELIITGFDGSDPSRAAARWAAREAERRRLPLELLQAWPWGPGRPLGTGQAERWGREQVAGEAEALRARHPGLDIRVSHVPEDPVSVLAAGSERAALLVLGSRGLGTLRGFLAGSVSQRVLDLAGCPVVLVRVREEDDDRRDVTVGLDLAHPDDPVLDFAFATSAVWQGPVTVVHAWQPPPGSEYLHFGAIDDRVAHRFAEDQERALEQALLPWRERYPEQEVRTDLVLGHAGITLVDEAARAGLLVIGTRHHRNPLGAHLGPVTHAVIHHAHCPVAVVPVC